MKSVTMIKGLKVWIGGIFIPLVFIISISEEYLEWIWNSLPFLVAFIFAKWIAFLLSIKILGMKAWKIKTLKITQQNAWRFEDLKAKTQKLLKTWKSSRQKDREMMTENRLYGWTLRKVMKNGVWSSSEIGQKLKENLKESWGMRWENNNWVSTPLIYRMDSQTHDRWKPAIMNMNIKRHCNWHIPVKRPIRLRPSC